MPPTPPGACPAERPASGPRRRVIQIAAAGFVAPFALTPAFAQASLVRGDQLVDDDVEGPPTPLRASDLRPGKPVLAYPFDAAKGVLRNETRLNKLVLMRFADADLSPDVRARAAGGVLAFSAICTHQACDVKTWLAKERVLVCFCHASKFALLDDGRPVSGPASRALPFVPLALEGDRLVVAGAFSSPPGGTA